MERIKFVYYEENNLWIGWIEDYPDYRSQGKTLDELKDNLKEIYSDIISGVIPSVRRYGELLVG